MVRHGARAPLILEPGVFSVPPGCLTPSGMRQKYLFGCRNRERYVDIYNFLDE
jgi:hypothetical protein